MRRSVHAQVLFELLDNGIEDSSEAIRHKVFSLYRDMPWTPEQRNLLQPTVREHLEEFVAYMFQLFDNVGGVLPDEVFGYKILGLQCDVYMEAEGPPDVIDVAEADIRSGHADYMTMWQEYLYEKQRKADT